MFIKETLRLLCCTQAIPGQAGLEHRIGGLEKSEDGGVSYDPENHEKMSQLRAEKVNGIAKSYDPIAVQGDKEGDLLIIGWGGTYGAIFSATKSLQDEGFAVSSIHLRHLNPLPNDLETLLSSFKKSNCSRAQLGAIEYYTESKICKRYNLI